MATLQASICGIFGSSLRKGPKERASGLLVQKRIESARKHDNLQAMWQSFIYRAEPIWAAGDMSGPSRLLSDGFAPAELLSWL